jgi:hypothetical protein
MDALFQELGVTNIDDAIAILEKTDLHCEVVVESTPICCAVELPLRPDKGVLCCGAPGPRKSPRQHPNGPKKSTRFSDDVRVQEFVANRADNVCPKEELPHAGGEVYPFQCSGGNYLDEESGSSRSELTLNNTFNSSPSVVDVQAKDSVVVMTRREVREHQAKNYLVASNPIDYVTTSILLDGNGIIAELSEDFLLDCIFNMMKVCEHLEEEGSSYTLSYKDSVTISNKVGKRQRKIVEKKIEELTALYL